MMQKKQSVYAKIADDLISKIRSGEYKTGTLLPPERVLKEQYGVERTTVRRSLELLSSAGYIEKRAGLGSVIISSQGKEKNETDDKAKKATGKEKILTPDSEKKSKKTILALFPSSHVKDSPFVSEIIDSLSRLCEENEEKLLFLTSDKKGEISEFVTKKPINACVVFSDASDEIIEFFRKKNIPVCFALCRRPDVYSVVPNIDDGCEAVAEWLIGAGHDAIAFLGSDEDVYLHHEYRTRFSEKISNICSESDLKNLTNTGGSDEKSGFERLSELIRRAGGSFTAAVAINDEVAEGALKAAKYYRISVPEELSVISLISSKKESEIDRIYTDPDCLAEEIYGYFAYPSPKRDGSVSMCSSLLLCGKTSDTAKKTSEKKKRLSDFLL